MAQRIAAGLRVGDERRDRDRPAIDARSSAPASPRSMRGSIPTTRNAMVRAEIKGAATCRRPALRCGSRCRPGRRARRSSIPVSALRKGSERRPRVRDPGRQGREAARPRPPGAERRGAGRHSPDRGWARARGAGRDLRLVQAARGRAGGCWRATPPSRRREERSDMRRSFTDIFIRHPVLAAVVNLAIVRDRLAGAHHPAGAAVSQDRELVRGDHHGLLRRRAPRPCAAS